MKPAVKMKKAVSILLALCLCFGMMNLSAFGIVATAADEATGNAGTPICGKEEHTHSAECYAVPKDTAGNDTYDNADDTELKGDLVCGKEEHQHTADCYQTPEPEADPETTVSEAVQKFLAAVEQIQAAMDGSSLDGEPDYSEIRSQVAAAMAMYEALDEAEKQDASVVEAYEALEAIDNELPPDKQPTPPSGDSAAMIDDTTYETLSAAIEAAETGATVVLLNDLTESIVVSKDITIDLGTHTLTGNGAITINIDNTASVTIKNGSIVGANGWRAIAATAKTKTVNLSVDHVAFTTSGSLTAEGKQTYGNDLGGACIYLNKGTLTVTDCSFTGSAGKFINSYNQEADPLGHQIYIGIPVTQAKINNSTFSGAVDQYGKGAIYCDGGSGSASRMVTISGCKFNDNTTPIVLKGKGTVTISNTTITNNAQALKIDTTTNSGSVILDHCTVENNNSTQYMITGGDDLTIKNSFIRHNTAKTNLFYIWRSSGYFTLENTEISDNSSQSTLLYLSVKGIKVSGSTISNNASSGSALLSFGCSDPFTMENTKITDNTTSGEGTVSLKCGKATALITGCTITGNSATNGSGLYLSTFGSATITNTTISRNTATNKSKLVSGGLYVGQTSGTVTLNGETHIYSNEAPNSTSLEIGSTSAADIGCKSKSLDISDSVLTYVDSEGVTYTLTKSTKTNLGGEGWYTVVTEPAKVSVNTSGGESTGENDFLFDNLEGAVAKAKEKGVTTIYICDNVVITEENAHILNDSTITFARCPEHPNGHMFTIKGNVTLSSAHIDGKNIESNSAMIYVPAGGYLTISDDTLIENGKNTSGNGGAICLSQSGMLMTGGTITGNTANQGGGIYAYGGGTKVVAFEGGIISKNHATGGYGGGGAFIGATSSSFGENGGRTTFADNVSDSLGGGVYLVNGVNASTTHHIYKATFTGNASNRFMRYFDGGAIYIESGTTVEMKNVFVSGNTSTASSSMNFTAVAVCPTGDLALYNLNGLLAVNNGSKPDIGIIDGGSVHRAVDPQIYLAPYAIGGGDVSYTFSNGKPLPEPFYQGYATFYTHASESAIAVARETAETNGVVIIGNTASQYGSAIMTNGLLKIGTETTSLKVVKVWDDEKNHDADQILVYLTRDGKIVEADFRNDAAVVLNKDNNWSYTWTNLGDEFEWGVAEAKVAGYSATVEVKKDTQFNRVADKYYIATITNRPSDNNASLVISKTAHGLDNNAKYKFELTLNIPETEDVFAINVAGTLSPIYGSNPTIEFTLQAGQTASIDGLPAGTTYKVVEKAGDEYITYSGIADDLVVTDEETGTSGSVKSQDKIEVNFVNVSKASITVKKTWDDLENEYSLRPQEITIQLMNGETVVDTATVTPDSNGNWSHTFEDLPKYDAKGAEITYTIHEVDIDNYAPEVTQDENGWSIENRLKLGKLTIHKVVEVVGGDISDIADKEFKFTITGPRGYANEITKEITVKANDETEIPNLVPGVYTITEVRGDAEIAGYTLAVTADETATVVYDDNVDFTVTNTYTLIKGSLQITKNIVGGGTEAANKTYTFDVTGPDGTTHTATVTGAGTATFDDLTPGTYTIAERNADIEGYTLEVTGDTTATVTNDGNTAQATITNTYTQELGNLTIRKEVNGGGTGAQNTTYRFTVTGPNGYSTTVSITGSGSATLTDLVPGNYTVTEDSANVTGYTWSATGSGVTTATVRANETAEVTITNNYTPEPSPTPTPTTTPEPTDSPEPSNTPEPSSTPEPSVPPTPTPSTPPTPTPSAPQEQTQPPEENDNPNEPQNPNEPTPEEDNPNQDIPNRDVPQGDRPDVPEDHPNNPNVPEDEPGTDLPDVDVPTSDFPPHTGETIMTIVWMGLLVVSGAGILITARTKKREER